MAYKTILVHCDAAKNVAHRLDVAAELAQQHDAHLVGFHARPPFRTPVFFDGGFPMDDFFKSYEASAAADQATALAAFEKATKGRHLSTEWRVVEGFVDSELAVQARYADLLVLGQTDPDNSLNTPSDLPEATALASGRPVLVVPHIGVATPPGKTVLLCWNASREAARAASEALPILKAAAKVIVLVIDAKPSPDGHGAEPGADAAAWLARHGVKVTVQRDTAADDDVGATILSRAADHAIDLIVMGLYGHSRMREMVLGGASRTLLGSMIVPVLMAH
ncbi:MAG: universal stress protein [Alphaproteobacteria bacterium]|jgi:nucleotide-binding universal stress UspA family protein